MYKSKFVECTSLTRNSDNFPWVLQFFRSDITIEYVLSDSKQKPIDMQLSKQSLSQQNAHNNEEKVDLHAWLIQQYLLIQVNHRCCFLLLVMVAIDLNIKETFFTRWSIWSIKLKYRSGQTLICLRIY